MIDTGYVEQALIGALLNDPTRIADVPWLRTEDFTHPLCRALWAYLAAERPSSPHPLSEVGQLAERLAQASDLHPAHRSTALLAQLQLDAPPRPAVTHYARMLVEASTIREVLAMGLRLADLNPDRPTESANQLTHIVHAVRGADQRWQHANGRRTHHDTGRGEDADAADAAAERSFAGHDGVAELDASPVRLRPVARAVGMPQDVAESAVIGAAIHNHPKGSRHDVLAGVATADFTDPARRATWAAVEDLHRRGEPLDEITVLWHLHHTTGPTASPSITTLRDTRTPAILYEQALHQLHVTRTTTYTSATRHVLTDLARPPGPDVEACLNTVATRASTTKAMLQALNPDRPRPVVPHRPRPESHCAGDGVPTNLR